MQSTPRIENLLQWQARLLSQSDPVIRSERRVSTGSGLVGRPSFPGLPFYGMVACREPR